MVEAPATRSSRRPTAILAALLASSPASHAFRSSVGTTAVGVSKAASSTTTTALAYQYYPENNWGPPPFVPYGEPYYGGPSGPRFNRAPPPLNYFNAPRPYNSSPLGPPYQGRGGGGPYPPRPPRRMMTEAAEVIQNDPDELREEVEEWMTDRERARRANKGEDLDDFDRPLKSAAASRRPADTVQEDKFVGRKPGQAVNAGQYKEEGGAEEFAQGTVGEDMNPNPTDPREQHVVLDDYEEYENVFRTPTPPRTMPGRDGPSVYTREEEELIASMGGTGQNQPPVPDGPNGVPMGGGQPRPGMREEGYLGDSTLREISHDYSVPIPYLADVLASWGVPVPIDPRARLGDMITGEQAFAVLEAIHTLDVASLHERYSEDDLMSICDYYDINMKEAFDFCVGRGWSLPFGVRTFLRVEQEEELLDALGREVY